jgi:hypothetical protein
VQSVSVEVIPASHHNFHFRRQVEVNEYQTALFRKQVDENPSSHLEVRVAVLNLTDDVDCVDASKNWVDVCDNIDVEPIPTNKRLDGIQDSFQLRIRSKFQEVSQHISLETCLKGARRKRLNQRLDAAVCLPHQLLFVVFVHQHRHVNHFVPQIVFEVL